MPELATYKGQPRRASILGEHTDEILAEIGLSDNEISTLHADHIVAGPRL